MAESAANSEPATAAAPAAPMPGLQCVGPAADTAGVVAAVVTVTFDRADYLRQHLDSVLAVHGRNAANRWALQCESTRL